MKKKNRLFIRILRAIYIFFDKVLITPVTKLFMSVNNFFKGSNKGFEKFINNKQTLIVLSLIFALATFYVIDKSSNAIINQTAEILYNQPVTAEYNKEAYVIEGLPESVDITLIGRNSDIYLAKQYPTNEVSVDLRDLKPGSHTVTLKYKQALNSLSYKLDPSTATIVVYEKVSMTKELTYDVLHKDSLDTKFVISNVALDRNDVIIKGAEYKLESVATVKALIDVDDITKQQVGELSLKDVTLVAYDSSGNTVDVEIVPGKVNATVTITSPSKELPINIVPTGDIAFGKAIKAITSSSSSVTVYGDQEALNSLNSYDVEIDVNGLDKNKEYNINLKNPSGIREMSVKTVVVKVELSESITKEFEGIKITPANLANGLKVQAASEADSAVTVVVTGSADAINALDPSSIVAKVDLTGLKAGTHDVEVKVSGGDNKLTYESKVKTVKVVIS